MNMNKVNKKFRLLTGVLVLSLLLLPVLGFGSNGFTSDQRDRAEGILTEKYSELPGVEFEFPETAAAFDDMTFNPYSNLAISLPNLTDGLVIGLVTYGDAPYLLIAVELPEGMGADYGAGLIDLSADEAVFAAKAEISEQEESVEEVGFELSSVDEDSPNLNLVVSGRKYIVETVIPKSM